uniref:Uncharacterized protein n=1 Tax=Salix viminalis TaxID=40686 RepID=A0A6N2MY73_SALVM
MYHYKSRFNFSNIVIKEGSSSEMCRYEASYPNPFNKGLSFASESYNFYHSPVSNFNVTIFHIIIVLCSNIGFGFKIFPLRYQDR